MPYSAPARPVMKARGDEGEQLVGVQIDAHDAGGGVVVADRDKGAADAAAPDVERGNSVRIGKAEAEIGEGGVAVEADAEDLRPLHRNAAGAVGQPPRLQDHGVDDEGEGQRRDREVKPLQPQRRRADDRGWPAPAPRRPPRKPTSGCMPYLETSDRIGVGAGDEEADMAERDQAGIAGQDVQAERADHRDQDDRSGTTARRSSARRARRSGAATSTADHSQTGGESTSATSSP